MTPVGVHDAAAEADLSQFPAADLDLLLEAIGRRRSAGRCGDHQRGRQPGCEAVAVWAAGCGPGGKVRPDVLFCRDRQGRYHAFRADGSLLAMGSMAELIRRWR